MPTARHYTDEEAAWIAEEAPRSTNSRVMSEAFEARFGRRMPPITLRSYCRNNGIAAGWQGTRDRSSEHKTRSGLWRVNGKQMAPARAAWVMSGREVPDGFIVTTCVPDDYSPENLRLVERGLWIRINQLGLRWADSATFDACMAIARIASARNARNDKRLRMRNPMGLKKIREIGRDK